MLPSFPLSLLLLSPPLFRFLHLLTQAVPYGVLCFLPSYKMLEKLSNRWQVCSTVVCSAANARKYNKAIRKIVEKWLSLPHSVCVGSNTVDRYYVCSVYAWAYRACHVFILISELLNSYLPNGLPGHSQTLPGLDQGGPGLGYTTATLVLYSVLHSYCKYGISA